MPLRIDESQNQPQKTQLSLALSHIYNKLIPVGHLHIYRTDDCNISVLNYIMRYQRLEQLF
jgi:hypothetical protein